MSLVWKEFREFVSRGNVLDLAIGIVIGNAFSKIVNSLVNDVIMPPIGLMLAKVNFGNLFINLSRQHYATLEKAKAAGAPTINYGLFINAVIDFMIVSLVIFFIIRQVNHFSKPTVESVPVKVSCPYCHSDISPKATRCPYCTSNLTPSDHNPS